MISFNAEPPKRLPSRRATSKTKRPPSIPSSRGRSGAVSLSSAPRLRSFSQPSGRFGLKSVEFSGLRSQEQQKWQQEHQKEEMWQQEQAQQKQQKVLQQQQELLKQQQEELLQQQELLKQQQEELLQQQELLKQQQEELLQQQQQNQELEKVIEKQLRGTNTAIDRQALCREPVMRQEEEEVRIQEQQIYNGTRAQIKGNSIMKLQQEPDDVCNKQQITPYCHSGKKPQRVFENDVFSPQPRDPLTKLAMVTPPENSSPTVILDDAKSCLHYECSFASEFDDTDIRRIKLVKYSICNSVIVKAIVHATPGDWRIDAGLPAYHVELHVHEINTKTYPMRRLLRLIKRKLPYGQDYLNADLPTKHKLLKGSLYIHRDDNEHLHFFSSVPHVMPLNGSVVMAEILDTVKTPLHGAVVHLRWTEKLPHQKRVSTNVDAQAVRKGVSNIESDEFGVHRPVQRSYSLSQQGIHRSDSSSSKNLEYYKNGNKDMSERVCSFLDSSHQRSKNICGISSDTENDKLKLLHITVNKSSVFVPSIAYST